MKKKKGLLISSDEWFDTIRRRLIYIMGASSGGPIFLKSINSSWTIKDGEYISKLVIKVIEDVDQKIVVQVFIDNAGNMKLASSIVELIILQIFWTSCVIHCLNLALKSICQPSKKLAHFSSSKWTLTLIIDVSSLKNFMVNPDMAHAIFPKYSELCKKLLKQGLLSILSWLLVFTK